MQVGTWKWVIGV